MCCEGMGLAASVSFAKEIAMNDGIAAARAAAVSTPHASGLLARALASAIATGSFAGAATTLAVALCGLRETGSGIAPINATSHVLWGDEAGGTDAIDAKHTATGLLINTGAGVFWALVQELLLARLQRPDRAARVASGAAVAGLAYVVDYHLIPRRLTPGWELRVSRRSVALGFVTLGVSLAVAAYVRARAHR
jgi:hypothetical protein